MFVPERYNESRRRWPMILFLHGYGESGDQIDLVLKHGPLKEALGRDDLDFLMVAPQIPPPAPPQIAFGWKNAQADLEQILDQVMKDYRVDEERVYLTGLSMGGFGSFYLAQARPELFAAVAPICGGGDATWATRYGSLPFWIFHGGKDRIVPPNRSAEIYQSMKALGCDAQYTLYPEAGHDSWTETYANDALYAWFLSHKRQRP
jgi:predicted peptidase